jgi:aerobic-type carbon monoxide dehydrogenase small subunit (CoxS/CutS family)
MKITFKVNGTSRTLEAEPDMPLLWALRDLLDLKGARYGCGIGECGACTVLVNGRAMRSCVVPLKSVEGDEIRTIEGLGGSHPVQLAWLEEQVPQCGFCQSGQIMQAVALLERTPRPTADEIRTGMNGVLCRCGTYPRIEAAVRRAADAQATTKAEG